MKKLILIFAALIGLIGMVHAQNAARAVMVNTNGVVVSPTNFWVNAPISTNAGSSNAVLTNTNGVMLGVFGSGAVTNPAIKIATTNTGFWHAIGPDRIGVSVNGVTAMQIYSNQVVANVIGDHTGSLAVSAGRAITFNGGANIAGTRTNLGLGWPALTNTNAATSLLGVTTNGQVVANTGTNVLTFPSIVSFDGGDVRFVATQIIGNGLYIDFDDGAVGGTITLDTNSSIAFQGASAATTRVNLGFNTNLNTAWTATNAVAFRNAIGAGDVFEGGEPEFISVLAETFNVQNIYDNGGAVQIDMVNGYLAYSGRSMLEWASSTNFLQVNVPFNFYVATGWIKTNAPANTTNVNRWIELQVGTNSYRMPLYQ